MKYGMVAIVIVMAMVGASAPHVFGAEPLCGVTAPNGVVAGKTEPQQGSYGNALLSVGPFGLWPAGTVIFKPGGAGFVTPRRRARHEVRLDARGSRSAESKRPSTRCGCACAQDRNSLLLRCNRVSGERIDLFDAGLLGGLRANRRS
jgi:hypothetical protein